jgi:phenylalanyl-tRNA synthetase alpha chain
MIDELKQIEEQARAELAAAADEASLDAWRVGWLGRKSRLTAVLRSLVNLPVEERRSVGAAANSLKRALESALAERQEQVQRARLAVIETGRLDVTLPGREKRLGRLHPVTQTLRDVLAAFVSMGFSIVEGPEVESDYYNFEALRIGKDHPARDTMDTLYVDIPHDGEYDVVMRTHTSPNQVRVMEKTRPPVRVVVPGRCYRNEATDPTHEWMQTQIEVLAVDEGISLSDLKGTLFEFAKRIFGQERRVRFRCDYFPFVEPGAEMAIDCVICGGAGCRLCGGEGWIEILGAGMVHPEILSNMGYDASRYTGFAAGLGMERVAMLRYGIEDIRLFYANDLRFLRQF